MYFFYLCSQNGICVLSKKNVENTLRIDFFIMHILKGLKWFCNYMKNKILSFLCVLCVCATLIVCSLIVVKPNVLFRKPSGIAVKGVASQRVVSDIATWSVSVSSSVKLEDVAKRNVFTEVSTYSKRIEAYLLGSGFEKSEISVSNVSVSNLFKKNQNGYDTDELCGKRADITISVQTKKFDLLAKAVENADKICGGEIDVSICAPTYLYSGIEGLKLDLLAKATENAKLRAKTLAEAGGAKLGSIMSASQGVFQITQPLSTEVASYGMYDTSTVEKDVRCVVNVQFAVGQ